MKFETEITVQFKIPYMEVHQRLINKGFKIVEEYHIRDIYMLNNDLDIYSIPSLEVLKKCVLVRFINGIKKELLFKYKEYADNGDIIKQGKVECPVEDTIKAIEFMKAINYQELFTIENTSYVYTNGIDELVVQLVNNEYLFIEMEDKASHIDKTYKDVNELKKVLDSYDLGYEKNNYFVKKALILLEKIKNERNY